MITGRKIRGDAKLEQLPEEQRECLHFWLEENCTYLEIARLVRDQFGVTVGKSTVGAYYRKHVMPRQHGDEAEVVAALAALPAGDFDAATIQRAKALRWSALARPQPEIDRAAKLTAIIEKAQRYALAVRKLELEERKVAWKEEKAAERKAGEERRAEKMRTEKMKDETLEIGKRGKATGAGESAEVVGRSEGAEIAAKAQSREGRSEGAEGGKLESGKVENGSELKDERPNLPRFPSCSEVSRAVAEAEPESEKMKDETLEIGKRGEAEGAEVVGRSGGAEVAAKALSREGVDGVSDTSAGSGAAKEIEQRTANVEHRASKGGERGTSGVSVFCAAVVEAARPMPVSEAQLPPLMPGFRRSVIGW